MNANNHTLHRLHDPVSFAWLSGLSPDMKGSAAAKSTCFGMDAIYLHSDMLTHYPAHLVLAIPPLNVPPVEYGFACTSRGQRWFCFVVVRKNASRCAALIFEVSASVLMFPAHGLRETGQDPSGNVVVGRDYPLAPLLPVLCPMDGLPVRYEVLQPDTGSYFCLSEGEPSLAAWVTPQSSQADQQGAIQAAAQGQPQNAPIYFDVGSPAFSAMRVNGNVALINLLGGLK
jgi:hypothetical protein